MVRLRLQVLPDFLHGEDLPADSVRRVPARHLLGQNLGIFAQLAVGLVEREHGLGRRRAGLGDGPDVRVPHWTVSEQGVAEHLPEARVELGVAVFGEFLEVDVERLPEAEQELDRHRPLIVLDEVQVARRNLELLRHLALLEAEILAKAANLVSQQDFPPHRPVCRRHRPQPM